MTSQETKISDALAEAELLDQKPKVETTTFSVYVPKSLEQGFKYACSLRGESHPTVLRRLMADYIRNTTQLTSSH